MSNQLDDFLISLGFDTSKIKSQVAGLEKALNKVAVETGKTQTKQVKKDMNGHVVLFQKAEHKRQKAAEKASKQVTKQKISDEQLVQRAIEARQAKELKREEDLYRIEQKRSKSKSFIESAKKQQDVRALLNKEANPQLKAMGNYYRQMQSSLIGSKRLETRRRGIVNTVRNVGAYRDFAATGKGSDERKLLAQILLQARKDSREDKYYRVRQLRADLVKRGRDAAMNARTTSGGKAFDVASYSKMQAGWSVNQIDPRFADGLRKQLAKAKTKTDVDRTIGTVSRVSRLKGADPNVVANAQNVEQLKRYGEELKRNNAELNAAARRSMGLAAAQGSLRDSTRNLVREYASLYAIFAGTAAIASSAKAYDGMQAGLVAVTNNATEAGTTLEALKEIILRNGLSMKDAGKDFVKLKAAMGKDRPIKDSIEAFEALTRAGVVFQISQDDMSGTIRALSQMFSKSGIQAEEFKTQIGDRLPIAMEALKKSTGKTAKELLEMMKQGKLSEEYILPFIKAMQDLAEANGAYEQALTKLGTVESQMKASAGYAAVRIAEAGFTEGLIGFYKDLTKAMTDNGKTLDQLGRMYKIVFNGLSYLLNNIVVPAVVSLGNAFDGLVSSMKVFKEFGLEIATGVGFVMLIGNFTKLLGLMKAFTLMLTSATLLGSLRLIGAAMVAAFRVPLIAITAIVGLLEEVQAVFDADLIGMGENINASEKDRDITAAYMKDKVNMASEKEKALLAANKDYIPTAVANAGGVGAGLMGLSSMANSVGNFKDKVLNAPPQFTGTIGGAVLPLIFNIHGVADVAQLKREIQDAVSKTQEHQLMSNSQGRY